MQVEETFLKGCYVVTPKVYWDERGYFFESFNKARFEEQTGLTVSFVQDNQSLSSKGVLRGLHFQEGDYTQAKLVRVAQGKVLDVCVDLRKESTTFGHYFSIVLDAIDHKQLYIPKGFAHGFLVLEDQTIFSYKCDNFYHKESERGIIYNDPDIGISWDLPTNELILSERDRKLPTFKAYLDGN